MQNRDFSLPKSKKIANLLLMLLTLLGSNTIAQVSNPRVPAEWEEQQAVVMELLLHSRWQSFVPWELAIDSYVKVAQACIDEDVDLYILERKSHIYSGYFFNEIGEYVHDTITAHLDTIFSNRGIISPNIHIVQVNDTLINNEPWARDNGMYCVYENNVDDMNMYHFYNDNTSETVDSIFNLTSEKIETTLARSFVDGGNFMTDGHGTFNIMNDNVTEVVPNYLYFNEYFGIIKSAKCFEAYDKGHIDLGMKMLNEETIIVSNYNEYAIPFIKENLRSVFDRDFKIITVQNAPGFNQGQFSNLEGIASYTNALIINNTILVPQYACRNFQPETDSVALEAYNKAMPGYSIIGVNGSAFQRRGGAIHCMTHEIPANNPIYIKHKWLADSIEYTNENYNISALVQSSQGISEVKLFWRLDSNESYFEQNMILLEADTYTANIPYQNINAEIEYYITATDNNLKSISKPYVAPKGTYKSKIVKVGAITHPDSLYRQAFFPSFPDGSAIGQATITIDNTTLTTHLLTNDTIAAIDLKPGKYSYTVNSPDIVGEYHGTINVNNRYLDTVNVTVNPFEFIIKGQHGDMLNDAEITLSNYPFTTTAPSTTQYAFEGNHSYKVTHPAMIDTVSATFTIAKNEYGNNYMSYRQQEQIVMSLDFYKLYIFPCLPNGTAAFETSIAINNTILTSNPLTSDSIVSILLPISEHSYTITSRSVIGEYNDTWQHNNSYTDTIQAIINPIEFLQNGKVVIGNSTYMANDSAYVYSFNGSYNYTFTHPAMVDTAYGELIVIENTYGNDYINYIPKERDKFAQLIILVDSIPHAGERFYKEKYPAVSYVIIPDDGRLYFANEGTYNYEIDFDRSWFNDTLSIDIGKTYTLNLMKCILNTNNTMCCMKIDKDTISRSLRTLSALIYEGEYPYTTFYKKGDTEIPLGSGIVSPSNKTITQNIHVPYYIIASDQGAPLINAQLRTNLGNNVFSENEKTFGVVFKENETITCTVSCEGYKDTTFTAHNDDLTHTIQLVSGENSVYYTITFLDHNDAELNIQTASEGSTAYAPNNPVRQGYTFTGWDVDFTNITDDITVTAQYSLDIITVLENTEGSKLAIYPNPVENTLTIDFGNSTQLKTIKVSIIDLTGKTVYQALNIGIENNQIDVSELEKGVYLISIGAEVRRIIKR